MDCGSCYHLDMAVVVAILVCDIILTFLIVLAVYCFVSRQKRTTDSVTQVKPCESSKRRTHTSSKRAKTVDVTESPYQELYGVQSDVYNDLIQYRK
ncbi:TYRO protein tyrosine kinase-binding protein [Chanos chanos]|uniref:TYRO protein tyrosine kinase-binding protein n=1 Tax=Chanos chanos TaxID=29144 RepID=A0A6J2W4J6_CHACN|nr:TYRO protein tyrosine kinase-binding protein [Chanos chanos]